MKQTTSAVLISNGTPRTHTCSLGEPDSVTPVLPEQSFPYVPMADSTDLAAFAAERQFCD